MNQLLRYLNAHTPLEQSDFAVRCGTTLGYLRKAVYTPNAKLGIDLCLAIAAESGGAVRPQALRPDLDWLKFYQTLQAISSAAPADMAVAP